MMARAYAVAGRPISPVILIAAGGTAVMLVVQGMQDRIAPLEHTAVLLKEEFGGRVRVAEIENAGHALLPEQRRAISAAIVDFIGGKT